MKKLLLSVATLMCATLMFSQNTSDVKQTGLNQSADVDQQGYNHAIVEQHYDSNVANIVQDGDGDISVPATLQTVDVYQNGTANDAGIVQGDGTAWGNSAQVIQTGVINTSRQTQMGDYNDGFVEQWNGYANLAVQEQTSPFNVSKGNTATVYQLWSNESVAYQTQFGAENNAYIEQWTGYHYADQLQDGTGNRATIGQDGMENNAVQDQFGNDNIAWATQTYALDWEDDALSGDNVSRQTQVGDDNEAYVSQDRWEYMVFETSAGGDDYLLKTAIYSGSKENEARQNQDGIANRAFSNQTGMFNLSVQDQFGSDNFSYVQQDGYTNYAWELQDGTGNRSQVYQLNSNNQSYVDQMGLNHTSKVDQDGTINFANIVQRD